MNDTLVHWRLERDADGIAWLHFNKADGSTNVLSEATLAQLDAQLVALSAQPPRGLVILSDKANGFIAGADVKEFTALTDKAGALALITRGQNVLDRLAKLPFPTLALIHGFCLGGGLELALACRYRLAEEEARLGLPEVRLGIHPGFGGSVRLPVLIGAPAAMDLMLSGRTVRARAAAKMGLIDYAVPQRHLLRAARRMMLDAPPAKRAQGWKAWTNHQWVRPLLAPLFKQQVAKRARADHYPAPYALIELWRKYGDEPVRMLPEEARSVANLIVTPTAQNLVRVFMLQDRLKSLGRAKDFTFKHVHVIGAGVMGGDIAAWCALRGLHVTLQDQTPERVAPAIKRAYALFQQQLKLPRLVNAAMDRLVPDCHGRGVICADVVIEAIYENREAKQALCRHLEPQLKRGALLATNTSSIPLQELSTALSNPAQLVGLHFFNPVAKMQLIEIVTSTETDPQQAARAAAFARHIDRLPLPVTSTRGFLVNRILMPYLLEAVRLESEGVPARVIDKAALDFGMPMGPILLADTVGLDVCLSVADILAQGQPDIVPARLRERVLAGRLGKKSGQGFYSYAHGKPVPVHQPSRPYLPPDISDRMILRLLNEAVACRREGVVTDDDLLDAGVIFGTGFAPFRGGPLHYIKRVGAASLLARLRILEQRYGNRYQPDPGWDVLVNS
ncbi:MAG: 3-hydroxyacyl-CoA dehydrogenase NAD-binding domain-containing protein [Gammaproteobacteria bacterium]